MNNFLLASHNVLRWVVLLFALYAITKFTLGLIKKQEFTKKHNLASLLFMSSLDIQFLLGIILYFTRGWAANLSKMGEIMGNTTQRFWTIEHIFGMLVAIALIHIGRSKAKKASKAAAKHKTSLIFFSIALLLIFATIPWPFRGEIARALWP